MEQREPREAERQQGWKEGTLAWSDSLLRQWLAERPLLSATVEPTIQGIIIQGK